MDPHKLMDHFAFVVSDDMGEFLAFRIPTFLAKWLKRLGL